MPHRLELIRDSGGIIVIDDSYNGNPDGVREAIKVLKTYKDKRKIYITPGLVEAAGRIKEIHNQIGEQLTHVDSTAAMVRADRMDHPR